MDEAKVPYLVLAFFLSLFFSGFFSMLEAAVISQDKHRLAHLAEQGDRRAVLMQAMLGNPERLLSVILLGNNLSNVVCAASASSLLTHWMGFSEGSFILLTLLVTFMLLVFSELTPKVIGVRFSQKISLFCAVGLKYLQVVLAPIIIVVQTCASAVLFLIGIKKEMRRLDIALNLKELKSVVRAASEAASKNEDGVPYTMIEQSLLLAELPVERIMTPRRSITGIDVSVDDVEIAKQVMAATHSKLPIYEGSINNIVGVVDCMSALKRIQHGRLAAEQLEKIAKPVYYAPAAAAAITQLKNMRDQNSHLALVTNGDGWIIGLLSFANFSAAIIGDEKSKAPRVSQEGDSLVASSDLSINQFNIETGRSLPSTPAHTINGMILEYLGDVPSHPVCLEIDGWRIEILKLSEHAIVRVRLTPPADVAGDV